jgi:formate dehydrogenase iron-sulfur subunit
MSNGILTDLTLCVGCGACRSACQEIHHFPDVESTTLDDRNFTVLHHYEFEDGNELWVRRMCHHCQDPACASVCLVGAFEKTSDGAVVYDADKCIGCRYCMLACPFEIPKYEWSKLSPKVRKCTLCYAERHVTAEMPVDDEGFLLDGQGKRLRIEGDVVTEEQRDNIIMMTTNSDDQRASACTVACPMDATIFGDTADLLAEALQRINDNPGDYVPRVYGKSEVGGTSVLYLSSIPFEELGFLTKLIHTPLPEKTWNALKVVPGVVVTAGVALGAIYWITSRRDDVRRFEEEQKQLIKKQRG